MASEFSASLLFERARPSYKTCHEVSAACPVSSTTLGYYPNEGVNIFLALGFAVTAIATIFFGVWKRTWGFSLAVAAGSILECAGYIGRVLMHHNPWNDSAFKLQIVAIILSPTVICIAIYLTLKHICFALNPSLSRIPPKIYPYVFVPGDVSCLVVQAIGGGIAAAAGSDKINLLNSGNRCIIAGICLQVVVLALFGLMSAEYIFRVRKWIHGDQVTPEAFALWTNRRFKIFLYAMTVAYTAILIRCIYRIAEMAGGWGNHIMQDEPSFVVLESFMVLIACAILAGFPPGIYFPQMSHMRQKNEEAGSEPKPQQSEGESGTEMTDQAVKSA